MSEYVKIAISFITTILKNNSNPTSDAIYELFEIQNGNKKVIIEHIKAIRNIMDKALEELEGRDNNEKSNHKNCKR